MPVGSLSTSCNNAVVLSSCYKVVDQNLLTNCMFNCRTITCSIKSVEFNKLCNKLSTSWEQACKRILLTSCWNSIASSDKSVASLLQFVRFYVCSSDSNNDSVLYSGRVLLTLDHHVWDAQTTTAYLYSGRVLLTLDHHVWDAQTTTAYYIVVEYYLH
jgi:hypothetical protein